MNMSSSGLSAKVTKESLKRERQVCGSYDTKCIDMSEKDSADCADIRSHDDVVDMSSIVKGKRARYGVIPYESIPITDPTRCKLCTPPWTLWSWSEEEWISAHVCMVEIDIGIWDIAPFPHCTIIGGHEHGCCSVPTTSAWITLHSAKYLCSHMNILDLYKMDRWSYPLVRINKIIDNGSTKKVHLSLFIFTTKCSPFVLMPKYCIRAQRSSYHSYIDNKNAVFSVKESDTFDIPSTLDHPGLKQFQRALLSQTLKLCSRQTFLEHMILTAPDIHTDSTFRPLLPVVNISDTIIVRKDMVKTFSDMVTLSCDVTYKSKGTTEWYPGGILVSNTGTGKTVMGCRLLNYLWNIHTRNKPLLLIVSSGMLETWYNHLHVWAPDIPKDQIVLVHDYGTMSCADDGDGVTKRLIVTTNYVYSRNQTIQNFVYSCMVVDDVHKNLPSCVKFPFVHYKGCIIGLTANDIKKNAIDLAFLDRLRVIDQCYMATIFNSITDKSIGNNVLNPAVCLSSPTYADTGNPIVRVPATCTTVHTMGADFNSAPISSYLVRVATALVKINSMASFTIDDFYESLQSHKTVSQLYQDMHRILAGDDRVIDPVMRILPPCANVSKDPFFSMLSYDEHIENRYSFNDDNKCAICLSGASDVTVLDCNHVFCSNCIRGWYMCARSNGKRCPNCRNMIKKGYTSNVSHFYMDGIGDKKYRNVACMEGLNVIDACIGEIRDEGESETTPSAMVKVVIVTRFSTVVRCIAERVVKLCPSWKVSRCTKSQSTGVRSKSIRDFCSGDTNVLVIDHSSANDDIDLTSASKLIMYGWFDKSESMRLQEKLAGIGQKNDIIDIVNIQGICFEKSFPIVKNIVSASIANAYAHNIVE